MNPRQCTNWIFFGLLLFLSIYVVIPGCSYAQSLHERFQAELDSLQVQYHFPGATAAYILPDGTAEVFAVGLSDVELKAAMSQDSRMPAASIGKTFVGAVVLALAQEGRLSLDDPVSKWLGDRSWFSRLPNHEIITLRHLLNHASGIPNHVEMEQFGAAFSKRWMDREQTFSPEELIEFVLDKEPLFQAGEGWYYTDTGYLLLGLIIEKVTGRTFYDEIAERFLEPLHLTLTSPSDRPELPGLASGYMSETNSFGLPPKTTSSPGVMAWNPGIEGAGGGFVSNAKDLVVWAKALYEGRAMKGDYLEDLLKSVPVSEDDSTTRYGAAAAVHEGGPFGPTYGHAGWIPGYCSSLRYYPDYGVGIAFQINTDIGIIDGSTPVMEDMEIRLAEIVITAVRH